MDNWTMVVVRGGEGEGSNNWRCEETENVVGGGEGITNNCEYGEQPVKTPSAEAKRKVKGNKEVSAIRENSQQRRGIKLKTAHSQHSHPVAFTNLLCLSLLTRIVALNGNGLLDVPPANATAGGGLCTPVSSSM